MPSLQVESMWRLGASPNAVKSFDLVVLDESEGLLRHFASSTVRNPVLTMSSLMMTIKGARLGVVTMDGLWGATTSAVLKAAGVSNLLVVNERRPTTPRTFAVSNDKAAWRSQILDDLAAGLNVVVVSLSSEMAMEIDKAAKEVIDADKCLIHTSKTGDAVKRQLVDVDALWTRHQLVVYSPTIAAGVDFSSLHFDRMYVYFCAMSALPQTAYQMAFRVRKVRDARVRCLVSSNMRPSRHASRPSVTTADMMSWLRWVDSGAESGTPHLARMTPGSQRTLDEMLIKSDVSTCILPPVTPLRLVMATVEAEEINAKSNFLHDFAAIAEEAGHLFVVDRIVSVAKPKEKAVGETALRLMSCLPYDSEVELEDARSRILSNAASEDDKWRIYAAAYRAGWGVDRVDEAFVSANGTQLGSSEAKLLARVICPALRSASADLCLAEKTSIFKAGHVEDVVRALGLKSPFDVETTVPDLMAAFDATVKHTAMFRQYRDAARLFKARQGELSGEWDARKVSKAINMVLGSVGLNFGPSDQASTGSGATRKKTAVNYRMDPGSVENMLQLVKMRLGMHLSNASTASAEVANEHAKAAIELCALTKYGHLIDEDRSGGAPFADYVFEDEEVDG
jgi:hypothetical protein